MRSAGQAAPRVKVLGHAIDNRRISHTFQWQSPVDSAAHDSISDIVLDTLFSVKPFSVVKYPVFFI